MVLVDENIKNAITMLNEKLTMCIEEEKDISIHAQVNGISIRNAAVIEEFEISERKVSLVGGWFELFIEGIIKNILYIDEENEADIIFETGELIISFE